MLRVNWPSCLAHLLLRDSHPDSIPCHWSDPHRHSTLHRLACSLSILLHPLPPLTVGLLLWMRRSSLTFTWQTYCCCLIPFTISIFLLPVLLILLLFPSLPLTFFATSFLGNHRSFTRYFRLGSTTNVGRRLDTAFTLGWGCDIAVV